jgi:hypothetical protein
VGPADLAAAVFPTGRLLSSRWRLVAWAGGLFTALAIVGNGLRPDIAEIAGIGTHGHPCSRPAAQPGAAVAAIVVRFWDTPVTGLEQHRPRRPENLDFSQT